VKTKKRTLKKESTRLSQIILIVAIVEPLIALPQIYEIYAKQDAGSVSFLTWFLYAFTGVIWLYYGLKINNRPLIITSILNIIMEVILVIGIVLYK
jgi:uncharacterized protein with PQ loop repeat